MKQMTKPMNRHRMKTGIKEQNLQKSKRRARSGIPLKASLEVPPYHGERIHKISLGKKAHQPAVDLADFVLETTSNS